MSWRDRTARWPRITGARHHKPGGGTALLTAGGGQIIIGDLLTYPWVGEATVAVFEGTWAWRSTPLGRLRVMQSGAQRPDGSNPC